MKVINETGKVYGRLKIASRAENDSAGQCVWECICECGKTLKVRGRDLRTGHTKSCGCWMREDSATRHTIHGAKGTRLYRIYQAAKTRVTNPRAAHWSYYGGRGITMCGRWLNSAAAFLADVRSGIGEPPPGCCLDRKDNEGNYEPGNIKWSTALQSARNTRHCKYLIFKGEKRCLAEWCQLLGLKYGRTKARLKRGWEIEKAFGP